MTEEVGAVLSINNDLTDYFCRFSLLKACAFPHFPFFLFFNIKVHFDQTNTDVEAHSTIVKEDYDFILTRATLMVVGDMSCCVMFVFLCLFLIFILKRVACMGMGKLKL